MLSKLKIVWIVLILLSLRMDATSQNDLYQLSGIVSEQTTKIPISYANIEVVGKYEWVYTSQEGFFSCVVARLDTIVFTAIGYKSKMYIVPDTLVDNIFSIAVYLSPDTLYLGEVEIFPWPSKEEFREAFLSYKEITEFEVGPLPGIKRRDEIDTIPKAPTVFQPITLFYEEVIVPIQWKKKKKAKAKELPRWE